MKRAIAGLLMALALILGSHPGPRRGVRFPSPRRGIRRRAVIKDCEIRGSRQGPQPFRRFHSSSPQKRDVDRDD